MNSVFLSPHFPPNFDTFALRLREGGANVLGVADQPYESLSPLLKHSLTEYYYVSDMHDYDQLVRALGYFTHKYGKLDHIDSHSEYWLETEAKLRTDFNIDGIKTGEIETIKCKSKMKEIFRSAGLSPARGAVCRDAESFWKFVSEVGYPVVAKPDNGVGAAATFKIENRTDAERFIVEKPPLDYIVEEFVKGDIVTFDGLVDRDGDLVFSSSLRYSSGIMDIVNQDDDLFYWAVRTIEPELETLGRAVLKAFDLKARFFHFEFFKTESGRIVPLEVNMRPPGGLTLNMFNYMFDFDACRVWSEMIVQGKKANYALRPYFVIYVGRKDRMNYKLNHLQVVERYKELLVHDERIQEVFARVIGNHGYILRDQALEPLLESARQMLSCS